MPRLYAQHSKSRLVPRILRCSNEMHCYLAASGMRAAFAQVQSTVRRRLANEAD